MKPASKLKRAIIIVGVIAVLYPMVGFFVLPPIVRSQLQKRGSAELGRRVTVEKVRLNPYALSVTLENFAIHEQDSTSVFLGWRRLYVNFSALASIASEWVLDEITLERLEGRLERKADLSLSVADILARLTPTTPAAPKKSPPSEPRPIRIAQLRVTESRFDFTDRSRGQPFTTALGPITFSLTDFRTAGARGAPLQFEAVTEAGEKIAWSGTVQAQPLRSSGKISLDDFSLTKHAPYYAEMLNGSLTGGTLSVQGRYELSLNPGTAPELVLLEGGVRLRGLTILERDHAEPVLELPTLDITGINADLTKRQASVDQVNVAGLQVRARREANGSINLLALAVPPAAPAATTPATPGTPEPTPAPFDVMVKEFALKDWRINILDNAAPQPTRLDLGELQVTVRNITLKEGAPIPVEIAGTWAPQGTLRLEGNVTLSPLSAQLKTALAGLDLRPLSPYLSQFAAARLTRGAVTANLDIEAKVPSDGPLAATVGGDIRLEDFDLVDAAQNEPLLGFGTLALSGLRVTAGAQPAIALQELALTGPYARVVVNADKSLNIAAALQPPAATPPTAEATPTVSAPPPPANPAPSPAPAPAAEPSITIARVVLAEGDYRFTDRSVEPAVNLAMNHFGGTIAGLSSTGEGQADVNLKAMVDGAGLVSITGRLDPLRAKKAMDLKIDVKDVDLLPLSPYSGKFAGFELARGKLLLDVKVALDGPKIDAANVLTLNQFTFGTPVKSAEATSLPVRLGVALLKDRAGNIVIDLPVQGSTDDPEFRIGKVVMRVIVNLLTKAATSPFSLLGAAFSGGGEELAYQDFAPGKAELLPTEEKKLKSLIEALANRPALNLALEGAYDEAADRYAMKRLKLSDQVRRRIWQTKQAADPNLPPPEQLVISADENAAMIKHLYDETFPPGTEFGAPLPPPPPVPAPPPPPPTWFMRAVATLTLQNRRDPQDAEAKKTQVAADHASAVKAALTEFKPLEEMSGRLAEAVEISDNDLRALGQQRSQQVRDALIAGGTSAERLFLSKDQPQPDATNTKQGARVFLTLQ